MNAYRAEDTPWHTTTEPPPYVGTSPWYNTEESAGYLRVTLDMMRRTLEHQIPYRQNGRGGPMYFHKQDLDRWAAAQTVQPVG